MGRVGAQIAILRRRPVAAALLLCLLVIGVAHALDAPALALLSADDPARLERRDWYRLLRVMGYLPTWLAVGLGVALAQRPRRARAPDAPPARAGVPRQRDAGLLAAAGWWTGGARLALSAALAGLVAEAAKRLIGRERPDAADPGYHFKPLFRAFVDDANLGIPSSHAAVAFGGAFMLARLYPGAGPVAVALAAGCALTRLLAGAHYLSDVAAAGLIGWATAWALRPRSPAGSSIHAGDAGHAPTPA